MANQPISKELVGKYLVNLDLLSWQESIESDTYIGEYWQMAVDLPNSIIVLYVQYFHTSNGRTVLPTYVHAYEGKSFVNVCIGTVLREFLISARVIVCTCTDKFKSTYL